MRLRAFGALALSLTLAGTVEPVAAQAATTLQDAVGTAPTEFYFASGAGDYIGGGATVDYTDPTVTVSSSLVTANVGGWTLDLAAPAGQQLTAGTTYSGATRYPFNTGDEPGISVYGNGRGCNNDYGTFTITEITATSVNATFSQTCESTAAAPLVGFIRFNATTATQVPTLPPALAAHLTATAGAGESDGETDVTLDASGTTGAHGTASYSFDFGDGTSPTVSSTPKVTRPEWEGTYKVVVTVTDADGRVASSAPQWLTVGDGYHALAPTRVLDTRKALGAAGPVTDHGKVTLTLPSSITNSGHGVLEAVVLNVTSTDSTGPGFVTAYPTGLAQNPTTSNLNYAKNETVANLVTVPVLADGKVVLAVNQVGGTVQLVADLEGYFTAGDDPTGAGYGSVTPTRIMDTRKGIGDVGGRIAPNKTVKLKLPSSVPAGVSAVALNLTAVSPSAGGYVAAYPDGTKMTTSNLNYSAKATTAGMAIVQVPADRIIDFTVISTGSADLLADLDGYFSTSAKSKFVPWFPTRLFDTRTNFLPGPLAQGNWVRTSMAYWLGVPTPAFTAGLYNVTPTEAQNYGVVSVVPDPITSPPSVSNVNFAKSQTVANSVLAPMTNGKQDFYNGGSAPTHLVVDFFGYFAQPITSTAPPTSANTSEQARAQVQTGSGPAGVQAPVSKLPPAAKSGLH